MGDTLRAGTDNGVCLRRSHRRSPTIFRDIRTKEPHPSATPTPSPEGKVIIKKPKGFHGLATAYAKVGDDMFLYLACTPDKYELPIYVADSAGEMAEYLGVPVNTVYKMTSRKRRQDRDGRKYKTDKLQLMRISTEEDDPLCAMCGKPFARRQHQQIYCSPTCRKAMAYQIIKEKEGKDP